MKKPIAYLYAIAGVLGSFAGSASAADTSMPSDVLALAWRDVQCRDWSNMAITDAATDYRVEQALYRLRCDRLAAEMKTLRRKYGQSPTALDAAPNIGP
jgi:hypothetical protein